MTNLSTTYLGLELKNPLVASASPFSKKIDTIRSANVKRILGLLEKMAKDDSEKYQKFWNEFGNVLKEGPAEDFENRERVAGLLRFATTKSEGEEQTVSLDEYIERMQEKQEKIYYVVAENFNTAKSSPHLEVFRKKGIEVLLLSDRVDDWLMNHPRFGRFISDFRAGRGIPIKTKLLAAVAMAAAFTYSVGWVVPGLPLKVIVATIGVWAIWYVLRLPTASRR